MTNSCSSLLILALLFRLMLINWCREESALKVTNLLKCSRATPPTKLVKSICLHVVSSSSQWSMVCHHSVRQSLKTHGTIWWSDRSIKLSGKLRTPKIKLKCLLNSNYFSKQCFKMIQKTDLLLIKSKITNGWKWRLWQIKMSRWLWRRESRRSLKKLMFQLNSKISRNRLKLITKRESRKSRWLVKRYLR